MNSREMCRLNAPFWAATVILAAIDGWVARYRLSTDDAVSYLDIGDAYMRGHWHEALNAYWSPFYSWLLGLLLRLTDPAPKWEFLVVKVANILLILFAFACFEFFLRQVIRHHWSSVKARTNERILCVPEWACVVSGYCLFMWSSLRWIGVGCDTPDAGTAAFVYLACGFLLRIQAGSRDWRHFAAFGVSLAAGYLCKTAMFPISLLLLAVALVTAQSPRRALPYVLISALAFAAVSGPFVAALSQQKGRLTFGDAGKLNYAWYVLDNVRPWRYWQGGEPGTGAPLHGPRMIWNHPEAYEFAQPIQGTYPLWDDPSYWYDGVKIRFDVRQQLKTIVKNSAYYLQTFGEMVLFALILLLYQRRSLRSVLRDLTRNRALVLAGLAGLAVYLVGTNLQASIPGQESTRFIAPFIVVLFAGIFSELSLPDSDESRRLVSGTAWAVTALLAVMLLLSGMKSIYNDESKSGAVEPRTEQWEVAQALSDLGMRSGDQVAIIGPYRHWARLNRVKVVAEVIDHREFREMNPEARAELVQVLHQAGARWIVYKAADGLPEPLPREGWRPAGRSGYYVRSI